MISTPDRRGFSSRRYWLFSHIPGIVIEPTGVAVGELSNTHPLYVLADHRDLPDEAGSKPANHFSLVKQAHEAGQWPIMDF